MKTLYNIVFLFFFALSSPYYFMRMRRRGNWQRGFAQRFGKYDNNLKQAITNRQVIWLHAVSVGEVNICTQLIRALEPRVPNLKIVVSTTTTTGMEELRRKLPTHISKIYYPIDRRRFVARAHGMLRPLAVVLVEAEIWPNFLWRAQRDQTPVFLVNARFSPKSFRRYKLAGFLFRPIFASFAGVGAQNEEDAARLRELGFRPEAIHVVGSMKYDAAQLSERRLIHVPTILRQLGVPEGAPVLIGGSTHPGEEAILGDVYLKLKPRFPDLFLIVVPRHFERSREAARDLQNRGVRLVFRTELNAQSSFPQGEVDCLVVNSTGELKYFYEHADVVFVGKSLTAEGGQNPIEPGSMSKAMVFGPNMQNFSEVVKQFVSREAAIQVPDARALEEAVGALLADKQRREDMGKRARIVVTENLGAIERTVEMIIQNMNHDEIYVAPGK